MAGKGHRQFTRRQRCEIATLLVQAALYALRDDQDSGVVRRQLGFGLMLLSEEKYKTAVEALEPGNVVGLLVGEGLTETAVAKWVDATFPPAVPANKKALEEVSA